MIIWSYQKTVCTHPFAITLAISHAWAQIVPTGANATRQKLRLRERELLTGYSDEDFKEEYEIERQIRMAQKLNAGEICQCPVCGEILTNEYEYHSDECDIIKGFIMWRKKHKIKEIE